MRIRQIKPHEAPLHLLQQKQWELEVYYEYAVREPENWHCFVVSDGNDDIALMIFMSEPLFQDLFCQTLIVDKGYRSPRHTIAILQLCRRMMLEVARELGLKTITASFPQGKRDLKPGALIRVLSRDGFQGYVMETTLREEVQP